MRRFIFFITLGFFCLTLSGLSEAQLRPGREGAGSGGPISISADALEAQGDSGLVIFKGAVLARQGDLSISCDSMKVYYSSRKKEGAAPPVNEAPAPAEEPAADAPLNPLAPDENQSIEKVECDGNVRLVEGDRLAVGDKALYLAQALPRRIILTGQARVWQGQDSVTGHEVVYYLDARRSTVEGGGGRNERVRATYHQEKPGEPAKPENAQ